MLHANNYNSVTVFVKLMCKILLVDFSGCDEYKQLEAGKLIDTAHTVYHSIDLFHLTF